MGLDPGPPHLPLEPMDTIWFQNISQTITPVIDRSQSGQMSQYSWPIFSVYPISPPLMGNHLIFKTRTWGTFKGTKLVQKDCLARGSPRTDTETSISRRRRSGGAQIMPAGRINQDSLLNAVTTLPLISYLLCNQDNPRL